AGPAAPAWSCPRRAAPRAPAVDARRARRGSPAAAARWGRRVCPRAQGYGRGWLWWDAFLQQRFQPRALMVGGCDQEQIPHAPFSKGAKARVSLRGPRPENRFLQKLAAEAAPTGIRTPRAMLLPITNHQSPDATARHRRQPHPRQLRLRPLRRAAARV